MWSTEENINAESKENIRIITNILIKKLWALYKKDFIIIYLFHFSTNQFSLYI